jgi:hypothetical protein
MVVGVLCGADPAGRMGEKVGAFRGMKKGWMNPMLREFATDSAGMK